VLMGDVFTRNAGLSLPSGEVDYLKDWQCWHPDYRYNGCNARTSTGVVGAAKGDRVRQARKAHDSSAGRPLVGASEMRGYSKCN